MNIEDKILAILKEKNIKFEVTEHRPVYTSQQAADIQNVSPGSGVKSLLLEASQAKYILALIPGDKRVNLNKISRLEKEKEVKLASPDDVFQITGCRVGSVPPFGHKSKLKTYLDELLLENEYVHFAPGNNTKTILINTKELIRCIDAKIERIVQ